MPAQFASINRPGFSALMLSKGPVYKRYRKLLAQL
jgi:hypothetical protein